MYHVEIVRKDYPSIYLNAIEEYYCTEKMFFAREKSGTAHYYSLDEISMIHIHEQAGGDEE